MMLVPTLVNFSAIALGSATLVILGRSLLPLLPLEWALAIAAFCLIGLALWWVVWASRRWFDWQSWGAIALAVAGVIWSFWL